MEFKDRVSNKPNRVKLTYEDSGVSSYATVELADEPIEEGTPLNKSTFDEMEKEIWSNFMPAVEDTVYSGCYYHMVGDEKEWINPPMIVGPEYRTTERFQNNVVYKTLIRITSDTINNNLSNGVLSLPPGEFPSKALVLKFNAWTDTHVLPYIRKNEKSDAFRRVSIFRSGEIFYEQTVGLGKPTDIWIEAWYYKRQRQ